MFAILVNSIMLILGFEFEFNVMIKFDWNYGWVVIILVT